jgi:hypothetical protein
MALILGAVGFAGVGCRADIHDNTVNINASITAMTDIDTNNVKPGQSIPISVTVSNVFLIEPSQTPPPEHAADAGHIEVFLDDDTTPPLLVTAQVMFSVTVQASTPPGHHKLICRVHKHDGTPTTTRFELNFTVVATVGGTPDSGVMMPDAGPPPDAGMPLDAAMPTDANM